jgi:hypothetical protein
MVPFQKGIRCQICQKGERFRTRAGTRPSASLFQRKGTNCPQECTGGRPSNWYICGWYPIWCRFSIPHNWISALPRRGGWQTASRVKVFKFLLVGGSLSRSLCTALPEVCPHIHDSHCDTHPNCGFFTSIAHHSLTHIHPAG